jgi:hypothetical protein
LRYKDIAGSKKKRFPFKHCFDLLQHLPKWKVRDQETAPKKSAMLKMDDEDEDKSGRNKDKNEGNKKANESIKMEAEEASFREKMDQMMRSREALTIKTLETKLIITDKKKEVKLAKVKARKEEAKCKAKFDERMLARKEARAMKEVLAVEKEVMMMSTRDMDKDQLMWWKKTKADIIERKRLLRQGRGPSGGGASTPQGEPPMSGGGGDGGLDHSADA